MLVHWDKLELKNKTNKHNLTNATPPPQKKKKQGSGAPRHTTDIAGIQKTEAE